MRTSLLALAVLLACAALLEGGARLALWRLGESGAPLEVGWERGDARGGNVRDLVYVPDSELFFRLTPGLALEKTANPRIFDLRTNALGLRGRETSREKPPGPGIPAPSPPSSKPASRGRGPTCAWRC
jgi:hypothetical protein